MGCLCMAGCCDCRQPMSKTIQAVSVIDLAIAIVFVCYETANFGELTGLIKYDQNCTNCTILRDYVPDDVLKRVKFETITVMAMIILVFLAFVIEGSLYSKLKSGQRSRVHYFCKQWFERRTILLIITVIMALAKYFRGFYSIYFDGVIDAITKLYRVITLWCVKCFMRELEYTTSIVYVKPPKPRKRGSLSLK